MPSLTDLQNEYVELIQAVSYLAGDKTQGAADIQSVMDFMGVPTPWARVVFDGESAEAPQGIGDNPVQQTRQDWSIFVGADGFDLAGQQATTENAYGVYQMVDDVIAAVVGKPLSLNPAAKPFLVRSGRHAMTANAVVYRIVVRNSYVRQAV
jgi:hypothetical protein